MRVTFLDTSVGTPTRSRNVSGLALQHGGNLYLPKKDDSLKDVT